MNPEKPSRHPDMPRLPEEELAGNDPRDEELFIDDAVKVYKKYLAKNADEQRTLDMRETCPLQRFFDTYEGSYETRRDFVSEKAADLGWYEALNFACQAGNVPAAVVALDINNAFEYLARYYHVFEGIDSDRLHTFLRPGVIAPESQLHQRLEGGEYDDE